MRNYLILLAVFTSLASASEENAAAGAANPETFFYELSEPAVSVTLPNLPPIEMQRHPLNAEQPHLRVAGEHERISVAIITPRAEPGMTPIGCASAVADEILAQHGLQPDMAFKGRADENTFLLIYGLPGEDFVLLNAHVLSAAQDDYCVEVHVSKISSSDADVAPWFNGFGESRIEAN